MAKRDTAQDLSITLLSTAHASLCGAMKAQRLRQDVDRDYEGQLTDDWHRISDVFWKLHETLTEMRERYDATEATAEEEA